MAGLDCRDVGEVLLGRLELADFRLAHLELLSQLGDLGLQTSVSFLTILSLRRLAGGKTAAKLVELRLQLIVGEAQPLGFRRMDRVIFSSRFEIFDGSLTRRKFAGKGL